jgi:hypothetical protein
LKKLSSFGYIVALIYLGYSSFVLYSIKGIVWLIFSFIGPIVVFPVWGYFLLGYSEPGTWILFIYLIIDSIFLSSKNNNSEDLTYSQKLSQNDEFKTNPDIEILEKKLAEISEEEKLKSLKLELNLKRQERGLVTLEELEEVEHNLKKLNFKLIEAEELVDEYSEDVNKFTRLKYIQIGCIFFGSILCVLSEASILFTIVWVSGLLVFFGYFFLRYSKKIDTFSREINYVQEEKDKIRIEVTKLATFIQANQL